MNEEREFVKKPEWPVNPLPSLCPLHETRAPWGRRRGFRDTLLPGRER